MQVIIDLHQFLRKFSLSIYASEVVTFPFSTYLKEGDREEKGEREGEEKQNNVTVNI